MAAVSITSFFIFAFIKDSHVEKPYKPDIIYVQQWRLDRTDAEIRAQQKIDEAELAKEQEKTRAEFQRLDDKLKRWGI